MAEETPKPEEVDELMKVLGVNDPAKTTPPPTGPGPITQEIEKIKKDIGAAPHAAPPPMPVALEPFTPVAPSARPESGLDLLRDVNVHVRVELGRARMYVQDILKLGPGSVVPLESLTGDPLDVYVNDRLVARGEVLVINENLAVRITEVISPQKAQEK